MTVAFDSNYNGAFTKL